MSINEMLQEGSATMLVVTPAQLKEFAISVVDEFGKVTEEPKYTPTEFARRKGVNKSTLHRWRKAGLLKPYYVGGTVFYRDSDLREGNE